MKEINDQRLIDLLDNQNNTNNKDRIKETLRKRSINNLNKMKEETHTILEANMKELINIIEENLKSYGVKLQNSEVEKIAQSFIIMSKSSTLMSEIASRIMNRRLKLNAINELIKEKSIPTMPKQIGNKTSKVGIIKKYKRLVKIYKRKVKESDDPKTVKIINPRDTALYLGIPTSERKAIERHLKYQRNKKYRKAHGIAPKSKNITLSNPQETKNDIVKEGK